MKIFQVVQKNFDLVGINSERKPFNRITSNTLVIVLLGVSSQWIFLFCEANSSQELMESIYVVTATTGILVSLTSAILNTKKMFSLINSVDELFIESK